MPGFKDLLAALLAVAVIGVLGLVLSFFLPPGVKAKEDEETDPADTTTAATS